MRAQPLPERNLYNLSGLFLLLAAVQGQGDEATLRSFLRQNMGFSAPDLYAMETGQVVTKLPPTLDDREVAVFGVVHLAFPKELFLEQFRDVATFRRSSAVPEIGTFSNPPSLDDVRRLNLPRQDLEALRRCRVENCDVKLPAAAIERFQREVDWDSPDYDERAADLVRELLVDYVGAYLEGGNAALGEYNDKAEPLLIAEGFRNLRLQAPYLMEFVPEFNTYLREFPSFELPGTEDFIYWAREDFGLKPVVTLTHATVYAKEQAGRDQVHIALKQIYASHYFHAALALMAFVDDLRDPARPKSYLLYLNRARFDGPLGGFQRSIVRRRLQGNAISSLKRIRSRLEEANQAEPAPAPGSS